MESNDHLVQSVLSSLTQTQICMGVCASSSDLIKSHRRLLGTWTGNCLGVSVVGALAKEETPEALGWFPKDSESWQISLGPLGQDWAPLVHLSGRIFAEMHASDDFKEVSVQKTSELYSEALRNHSPIPELYRVWLLADILFFGPQNTLLSDSYIGWLNETMGLSENFTKLASHVAPFTQPGYWPCITQALLCGQTKVVVSLLQRHDLYQSGSPIHSLVQVIQDMPRLYQFSSKSEFSDEWQSWKSTVSLYTSNESRAVFTKSLDASLAKKISTLFHILAGDEAVIVKQDASWQECLGALILYTNPLVTFKNIDTLLDQSLFQKTQSDALSSLEASLLKKDLRSALRLASQFDWWLVAHLTDLLVTAGVLEEDSLRIPSEAGGLEQNFCTLREWYLSQYAELVFPMSWQVAFDYFLQLPVTGQAMISTLCQHVSRKESEALIEYLDNHAFLKESALLNRIVASESLSQGNLSQALARYAKAGSASRLYAIVEKILSQDPTVQQLDALLEQVETSLVISFDSLAFLSRYRDFLQLYSQKSFKEAGSLLVSLFSSGSVPRQYWSKLLTDALGLLESQIISIGVSGSYELLRVMEELRVSGHAWTGDQIVQMALGRNLARALAAGIA